MWNEVNPYRRREVEKPTSWLKGEILSMERMYRVWWKNKKCDEGRYILFRNRNGTAVGVCKEKAKLMDEYNFKFLFNYES